MALGNRSVTDLPILTAIGGAWVYNATGGVDYRVAIGGLNGLAYTAGDGTLSPTIHVSWSQNINTPTTLAGYGITNAVSTTASQSANTFLAAPNGSSGAPSFRTILASDIPTLNQNTTGSSGSTTGNAATATALQTPRTINGVAFDGTANINLPAGTTAWGSISGTLSSQTDLQTALNGKAGTTGSGASGTWAISISGTAAAASSVAWGNVSSKPTTRDGYGITDVPKTDGTSASGTWGISISGNAASASSVAWTNVSGRPTTVSAFTNDSGYITSSGSISGNANTASVLQNIRTINGTNFNGSANITTDSWGTARTLTIGNTGKSVNGSGNVSWSMGEIGIYVQSADPGSVPDGSLWVW